MEKIRNLFFVLFRRRRMRRFYATFRPTAHTRLLDIGGTPHTWIFESPSSHPIPVTLVNLEFLDPDTCNGRFTAVQGDATELPFENESFDIAFSNSVIEHLTTWERQQAFASEARRVAKKLWIQTPARSFPVEPHVFGPFFHFLPKNLQRKTARYLTVWGLTTKPDRARIEEMLSEIRLLTYREMRQLFPDCTIVRERFFTFTKSYIAVRDSA
jgi:Methyltransferase domain